MTNLVLVDVSSEGLLKQVDLEQVLLGQVDFGAGALGSAGAGFAGAGGGTGGSAILRTFNSHLPYLKQAYIPVFSPVLLLSSCLASHWLK